MSKQYRKYPLVPGIRIVYEETIMNPFNNKWLKIGIDTNTNKWVYNVRSVEIKQWIEEQPVHMWKFFDIYDTNVEHSIGMLGQNYVFTDELETWFQLRWS